MTTAPNFLDETGAASLATMVMMSHHGMRRDLALFARALAAPGTPLAPGRAAALGEEWLKFRGTLHGHHAAEDGGLFPMVRAQRPALGEILDGLGADHRRIDPVLERGDALFARLGEPGQAAAAAALVRELSGLLAPHLATEEANVGPVLRAVRTFELPIKTDEEAAMVAEGFAWSSQGIAPEVLERVHALVPERVAVRLPAARAAFRERQLRVWGEEPPGASRTAAPEHLPFPPG